MLYVFDDVAGGKTGSIFFNSTTTKIEINPVKRFAVPEFNQGADITWVGAVVNFSSGNAADTMYPSTGVNGLWVLASTHRLSVSARI